MNRRAKSISPELVTAIRQIDPGWSGKNLEIPEPVKVTLPNGMNPIDFLLQGGRDRERLQAMAMVLDIHLEDLNRHLDTLLQESRPLPVQRLAEIRKALGIG